mgnify:CR=1 FL=1
MCFRKRTYAQRLRQYFNKQKSLNGNNRSNEVPE